MNMNCPLCNAPPPLHSANCPNATTVASLAAKRFEKIGDPSAHEALSALDVARDWVLNHAEGPPDHIIVLIGRTTRDNSSGPSISRQDHTRTTLKWACVSRVWK